MLGLKLSIIISKELNKSKFIFLFANNFPFSWKSTQRDFEKIEQIKKENQLTMQKNENGHFPFSQ
jgi:hypothetical protein